jgi:hypothetical protein
MKLLRLQRGGVASVGVEDEQERGALVHDADARMCVSVNPSLMAFGQTKRSLQVKVVQRQLSILPPGEEAGGEGSDESRHVLVGRILARLELGRESVKGGSSPLTRGARQGQRDGFDAVGAWALAPRVGSSGAARGPLFSGFGGTSDGRLGGGLEHAGSGRRVLRLAGWRLERRCPTRRTGARMPPLAWPWARLRAASAARRPSFDLKRLPDSLHLFGMAPDDLELLLNEACSALNTAEQIGQGAIRRPPFFAARLCRTDSATSSSASAMRTPGGCSGPPWSSLRIPRVAAQ